MAVLVYFVLRGAWYVIWQAHVLLLVHVETGSPSTLSTYPISALPTSQEFRSLRSLPLSPMCARLAGPLAPPAPPSGRPIPVLERGLAQQAAKGALSEALLFQNPEALLGNYSFGSPGRWPPAPPPEAARCC
jgi:hypothetical protein